MTEPINSDIPKKARELLDKGLSAMERGNLSYAMDMFMAALDIEPRFFQARKLLRVAAIKEFKKSGGGALTHIAASIRGAFLLISGFMALRTGKNAKALSAAEKLLRKDPLNLPFIRLGCKAAAAENMPEAAIHTLLLAREHYPENTEIISWLGRLYTETNKLKEARACFEKIVELRPNDARALRDLKDAMARDTMSKGGWREVSTGEGTYRDVIRDVRKADVHEQEEKAVKVERSLELLIEESESRLEQTPENMTERRTLAKLYAQATRFKDAIRVLEDGSRITGISDPAIDQLLNTIRIKQFDHEIARLKAEGDSDGAAKIEAEKQKFAFQDVADRVKRYPNDLSLRYEFGVLLYEKGQVNEAIQQFQISERNPSLRVKSLYYIALCFKQKKQFDMARAQLEKAASGLTEMDDLMKSIYYELGQVLESMGDQAAAIDQYYKAIYQVDIGYRDVAEKIENAYKDNQPNN